MNGSTSMTMKGAEIFRNPTSPPCGSVAELRAFLGEAIGLAAVHADLAQTYSTIGDDRGLGYALRWLRCLVKGRTRNLRRP
jgi:hypothetical protein